MAKKHMQAVKLAVLTLQNYQSLTTEAKSTFVWVFTQSWSAGVTKRCLWLQNHRSNIVKYEYSPYLCFTLSLI